MIKNRFVLIDAFALIFRAYYAIPATLTKDGQPVNAAYGFASALLSAIKTLEPEYLAVGMDFPKPTLRHKDYVEYKAHRAPAPDDLVSQIPYTKEILKVMNIPTYAVEGYEGEDIIATVVAKVKAIPQTANGLPQKGNINIPNSGWRKAESGKANLEFIIVTGDLDLLQLVDSQTKVYSMARGINQAAMYDEKKVQERYGLTPAQFVDFKALKGDASDNIPGVKGIGEKGAAKLIIDYKNLENIYKNIDKISPKLKTLLLEQKEQAFLSQKLSKIQNNAPLEFRLEDARIHEYNQNEVIRHFNRLGFKSLIPRLPREIQNHRQEKLL